MNKLARIVCIVFALMVLSASTAMAQPAGGTAADAVRTAVAFDPRFIGIGLVVIGAAFGIGKLATAAYDGMSRQPEVAGKINTAMIIAAALIEGFTLFALVICLIK